MTEPATGKTPSWLAARAGRTDCRAIDAAVLRASVRQWIWWIARCAEPDQVAGGR